MAMKNNIYSFAFLIAFPWISIASIFLFWTQDDFYPCEPHSLTYLNCLFLYFLFFPNFSEVKWSKRLLLVRAYLNLLSYDKCLCVHEYDTEKDSLFFMVAILPDTFTSVWCCEILLIESGFPLFEL